LKLPENLNQLLQTCSKNKGKHVKYENNLTKLRISKNRYYFLKIRKLGVVVHTCNPCTQKTKAGLVEWFGDRGPAACLENMAPCVQTQYRKTEREKMNSRIENHSNQNENSPLPFNNKFDLVKKNH
jgi:hypothetical protein